MNSVGVFTTHDVTIPVFSFRQQIDMLGKNVYEFVCEKDGEELKKQFTSKYQGREIQGFGLNEHGQPVEMNIRCSTAAGKWLLPVYRKHGQLLTPFYCRPQLRNAFLDLRDPPEVKACIVIN